jgi:Spherulation-specific family 4
VSDEGAPGRRLLIPAYFYPGGSEWQEMCDALEGARAEAVIVMNPGDGPGAAADWKYADAVAYCHAKGQTVIGYVDTAYGARAFSLVTTDIDRFFELYALDGIFVDQVSNDSRRRITGYYRRLYRYIKERWPDALVVGNPGVPAVTRWQVRSTPIADVLVVFEGSAQEYAHWRPPRWVSARDAAAFAHLVYGSEGAAMTASICAAAGERHAGWIYVTRGDGANPWGLPPETALIDCPALARRPAAD